MSISNYAELKILDHLTGTTSWTAPALVYVQLHTGDPGEAGTSNVATETTRKLASFSSASAGSISTSVALEWTSVSANETVSHWSLWDASTAGNCLWYGALNASASVVAGDNLQITSMSLTLD